MRTERLAGLGPDALPGVCQALLDWLGTIEMPEDSVGIREAGGCLGGMLVGILTTGQATFVPAESSNVARLCGLLEPEGEGRVLIAAIGRIAAEVAEGAEEVLVGFEGVG